MTTLVETLDRYQEKTSTSRALFSRANSIIPGGVSRATLAFEPYPFYVEEAQGAIVTDVDGNRYIDLINNYTSLPHGHGHVPTVTAATEQLRVSSAIGYPHPIEAEFAEELRRRVPAMERLHFTTTGSEAVGFGVRIARANTGRTRVLKFEGGFHGSHNELYQDIAVQPPLSAGTAVPSRPSSAGLEPTGTITGVYNDAESVREAFRVWGDEIAVVVLEPFLGNSALVTASRDFLDEIFSSAAASGALVLFDEVQSLRAGFGGAQGLWGYHPDLVALGKIMGGGYPLAAYGGRADLFGVLEAPDLAVLQTGTFTATAAFVAAGQAAMAELDRAAYDVLSARTARLRAGISEVFSAAGVPVHVNGLGSMFNIAVSAVPVDSYRTHRDADSELLSRLRLELLLRGVLIMPRGTGALSTVVTDDDVENVIAALDESLTAAR